MRGVVLSSIKYSDNSNVVTIFLEHDGLQSFILHRGKGRSRLHGAIFNACCLVDVEYTCHADKAIQYAREVKLFRPLNGIFSSPHKAIIAMFIAEVMKHSLKGEKDNPQLFKFIQESILWLDMVGEPAESMVGAVPELVEGVESKEETNLDGFPAMFLTTLLSYIGYDLRYSSNSHILTDTADTQTTLRHIIDIYRQHIPAFPELKSLSMMEVINS